MPDLAATLDARPAELPAPAPGNRFFYLTALVLLTIATAFRVYHLGDRSLWFDEALTADMSRTTLTQMLQQQQARGSAPLIHPVIMYAVQKVASTAVIVRIPSVIAGLLAVLAMLAMVRVKLSRLAALFSAAILAISVSEIRYSQEVREYSLTVLFGTVLIFLLLQWEARGARDREPVWLYAALFLAPQVQYGLALLGLAILSTIGLRAFFVSDSRFRIRHVIVGAMCLAAGGITSFLLILRYQFHLGRGHWYLVDDYFDPKTMKLLHFLTANTRELLGFVMPGRSIILCLGIGALIFLCSQALNRKLEPITLVAGTSVLITIAASIGGVYPYGGIRQCLFLAPGITLFAGVVFADLVERLKNAPLRTGATVAFLALILFSGYRNVVKVWPYAEYEDTLSILRELNKSSNPNDQIWVNHDAVAALDFYTQGKDKRFIYGNYHGDAPQEYVPELLGSVNQSRDRFWLVFSHLQQPSDRSEEQLIVHSLASTWTVNRVLAPVNASLYIAQRKMPPS